MKQYTVEEIFKEKEQEGELRIALQGISLDIVWEDDRKLSDAAKKSFIIAYSILKSYVNGEMVEKAEVMGIVDDYKIGKEKNYYRGTSEGAVILNEVKLELKRRIESLGGK